MNNVQPAGYGAMAQLAIIGSILQYFPKYTWGDGQQEQQEQAQASFAGMSGLFFILHHLLVEDAIKDRVVVHYQAVYAVIFIRHFLPYTRQT